LGILVPLQLPLPLNLKVNASRRSILGDLLAVNQHFKFRHARPLQAAHGLRGFGNRILSRFGEAAKGGRIRRKEKTFRPPFLLPVM
jgi:hypothetical protein